MSQQHTASSYWGNHTYPPNWYGFPRTSAYIMESITGQHTVPLTPWLLDRYFPERPIPRAVTIACGDGKKEISWVKAGLIERLDVIDIAAEAVERGRQHAASLGLADRVQCLVQDLNAPELDEAAYDLIYANGALHHLHDLETATTAFSRALKPGGYLLASEFTGPTRFRYTDREIEHINLGRALLPPELGGDEPWTTDELQGKLEWDPSEAARSREVVPLVQATFDQVIVRFYGGNVLMRALGPPFFANFDAENEQHREAVERVIAYERSLLASGAPSHHAYLIARRLP
jgi:SAM-dependent methyltransferase